MKSYRSRHLDRSKEKKGKCESVNPEYALRIHSLEYALWEMKRIYVWLGKLTLNRSFTFSIALPVTKCMKYHYCIHPRFFPMESIVHNSLRSRHGSLFQSPTNSNPSSRSDLVWKAHLWPGFTRVDRIFELKS